MRGIVPASSNQRYKRSSTLASTASMGTQPTGRAGTLVVHSELRSRAGSRSHRRLARDIAWDWVAARWARLLPSPSERERPRLECSLPGRSLSVSTSADGLTWTLAVAHSERDGSRIWRTEASVREAGEVDVIGLQTTCSSSAGAPLVIAPPKLLGAWVQNLELEDGGFPVLGEARMVNDEDQFAAFATQLLSDARRLPLIVLANKPRSRYYGVDPRGLAEAVRGLAHVACIEPDMAIELARQFTGPLAPVPAAARIYRPGFSAAAARGDHPLIREPARRVAATAIDQGGFRRLLCRRICEMSAAGN